MDVVINIAVEILRLVPLILAFYIPALMGVVLLRERGDDYRLRAGLVFAIGFGGIVAVQLLLRSTSVIQVAGTLGLSLVQIAVALALAALTVYKLAD
jgi:hypothetical protein